MTKNKILIVEDEPLIALDIQSRLKHLGHDVVAIADSAETALDAIATTHPELVFMDIQIQGKVNGIQTAEQVRERHQLPVVFLTAHTDPATLNQAKMSCPFGYVTKPFKTQDLDIAIEIALSQFNAQQMVQKAWEREKQLNEQKSRFVSIVSHEFRNPLGSILFALELLQQLDQQLTLDKKELYFSRAIASVHQMRELLEEVLTLGEVEAHALKCRPIQIDLVEFCQSLIDEMQTAKLSHRILLAIGAWPSQFNSCCLIDEKLFTHIFRNLITNAIKYSPSNKKIDVKISCDSHNLFLTVQDYGIGIPPEDRARLFDAFYRASNVGVIQGTGLGLAIVQQCVGLLKGYITFESCVGLGSTFTVSLPFIPAL